MGATEAAFFDTKSIAAWTTEAMEAQYYEVDICIPNEIKLGVSQKTLTSNTVHVPMHRPQNHIRVARRRPHTVRAYFVSTSFQRRTKQLINFVLYDIENASTAHPLRHLTRPES
jgi:hypothetical protein